MKLKAASPLILVVIMAGCIVSNNRIAVLIAAREAPLGWVSFRLYPDNQFTLSNDGIREGTDYNGTYIQNNDTLILSYVNPPPFTGCDTAIISEKFIHFDVCLGSLEITKNEYIHE